MENYLGRRPIIRIRGPETMGKGRKRLDYRSKFGIPNKRGRGAEKWASWK